MLACGHIHLLNVTGIDGKNAATVQNYGAKLKADEPPGEAMRESGPVRCNAQTALGQVAILPVHGHHLQYIGERSAIESDSSRSAMTLIH